MVVVDINSQAAEDVMEKLQVSSYDALAVKTDVLIAGEVSKLLSAVSSTFGHIDILVNNARLSLFVPTTEMTEEQ